MHVKAIFELCFTYHTAKHEVGNSLRKGASKMVKTTQLEPL